jgi:uncharacterized protein
MENNTLQAQLLSKRLASWEIISVTSSAVIALWVVQVFARHRYWIGAVPLLLSLGLMFVSHRIRGETARDVGFRFDNFLAALKLLVLPTIIAAALILLLIWMYSGRLTVSPFRSRLLFVPLWALFQQYALQGFINRRAQIVVGTGTSSALLTALVFSILHLPSPLLAVLTLLGAFVWSLVYQRRPNLFALAISHTIASVLLSMFLPPNLTPMLRVGFKYFG